MKYHASWCGGVGREPSPSAYSRVGGLSKNWLLRSVAGSPSVAGAHSAVATLEQLAKPSRRPWGQSRPLPPIFVADEPAYGWRGFHLDVARHFFKVPTVEALVRRLARLKFNVLHLEAG